MGIGKHRLLKVKFRRIWLGYAVIICLFMSCSKSKTTTETSFYYWKTVFDIDSNLKAVINDNEINRLYVRFFDIQIKNGQAIPLSPILFKTKPDISIVPVIYIKNEVMLDSLVDLQDLAQKTYGLIEQIAVKNNIQVEEIQLDCDWTLRSKSNYFDFIKAIKAVSQKNITSTIRLHQVKYYQKTGIPPVDKGVLMYYNMGKILPDKSNSIYERKTAQLYLKSLLNYPLELDVALPIYSWTIVSRNGKVINLLSKTTVQDYTDITKFRPLDPNRFVVTEANIKSGMFLKINDTIKVEAISKTDMDEMVEDLSRYLKQKPATLIYYDLDTINTTTFTDDKTFFKKTGARF